MLLVFRDRRQLLKKRKKDWVFISNQAICRSLSLVFNICICIQRKSRELLRSMKKRREKKRVGKGNKEIAGRQTVSYV